MSLRLKVSSLFAFVVVAAHATVFVLNGPINPSTGLPCVVPAPNCVITGNGSYNDYDILGGTLSSPTVPGGMWTLSIQTDYPLAPPGGITGGLFTNAPYPSPTTGPYTHGTYGSFNVGDFLMFVNGTPIGGIALSNHSGVTAGGLYVDTNGFLSSCQVLTQGNPASCPASTGPVIPRGDIPVWLAPPTNGSFSAGTELVTANPGSPDGITTALYTVTDTFAAPANFLSTLTSGTDLFEISSFVCANGIAEGTGSAVPEPRTAFLFVPALLLAAHFARRRYVSAR